MAAGLVIQRRLVPISQPGTQGAGRVVLAVLAVDGFQPALQRLGGLLVQLPQQHGLPVVPGPRPHPANVADRQHGQKVKPLAGLYRLGKVAHRARVADIALLRHVGHKQVIAHQPFDRFAFLCVQTQPGADAAGKLRAQDRMILGPSLADVVQQKGDIDHSPVDPAFQDAAGDRQLFDQFAALDLGQAADGLDDVLVHRVVVIDVELHHRDDGFEFRDEGRQDPQFVHPAQAAFGVPVFQQQVKEQSLRLGVLAHVVVDQVQIPGQEPHDVGVKQIAGAQRLFKDAQKVQLVGQKGPGVGHIDPALHQLIALADPLGQLEDPEQAGFALGVAGLQLGQEDAGQFAHLGGLAKVVLHEMLDRAPPARIAIAHPRRDFDLQVKGQHIGRAPGDIVQMAARGPQEIFGPGKAVKLVAVQQPRPDQPFGAGHPVQVLADPVQCLQVAEAALAFLDVRLQHIALPALPPVPIRAFCQLRLDEFRAGVAEQFAPQLVAQFRRQRLMPADVTMLQQGGADCHILTPQTQAVLHRTAGVADLQLQVPQHVQHRLDDAFGPGGDLPRRQEQQVHVRLRGHFGPAIAAHAQDGDPFGLGRVGQGVQHQRRVQGDPDQDIRQKRLRRHQVACGAGGLQKTRLEPGVRRRLGRRQMPHDDCPRGLAVTRIGQVAPDGCGQRGLVRKRMDGPGRVADQSLGSVGHDVRTRPRQSCAARRRSRQPDPTGWLRWLGPVRSCRSAAAGKCPTRPQNRRIASAPRG